MYSLNEVIKKFNSIIRKTDDGVKKSYYETIVEYLLLEREYTLEVRRAGKPIYHYFKFQLPNESTDYFHFLYNTYNPVRFAVETFDSIEEIRLELEKRRKN
jgi:hypothetical protein